MSKQHNGMDERSGHFYRAVFNKVLLNLHAVRMGYFDTLLCETDDPRVMRRWEETVPRIAEIMRQQASDNKSDREK
jgi:hypothetical protein